MTCAPWLHDDFDYDDFSVSDFDVEDDSDSVDYDPDEDFREALTAAERNPSMLH